MKNPTPIMNKPKPQNTGFLREPPKETDERSNNHPGYFITAQDHSYLEAVHLETKIKTA